ncbi:hypothetical protein PUN28_009777 [Cardiocondyla obscurior]|uniref:Myb/SANT-like DNA-binding domain-containing protein n=1 Tax=Cardiocondyla obscurior TaxID=286306 RepID=A0AAW2FLV1_9HYME
MEELVSVTFKNEETDKTLILQLSPTSAERANNAYTLREPLLTTGKLSQKKAWLEIAAHLITKGYNVTDKQCMTRMNTMKRTYKNIENHNCKSGNNRRTLQYFDIMDDFLGKKPYMTPLVTVSSNKKRKAEEMDSIREEAKNKRHRERIDIQQKLIETLDKFIQIYEMLHRGRCTGSVLRDP